MLQSYSPTTYSHFNNLNTQLTDFCTTALFHQSEILHNWNSLSFFWQFSCIQIYVLIPPTIKHH